MYLANENEGKRAENEPWHHFNLIEWDAIFLLFTLFSRKLFQLQTCSSEEERRERENIFLVIQPFSRVILFPFFHKLRSFYVHSSFSCSTSLNQSTKRESGNSCKSNRRTKSKHAVPKNLDILSLRSFHFETSIFFPQPDPFPIRTTHWIELPNEHQDVSLFNCSLPLYNQL